MRAQEPPVLTQEPPVQGQWGEIQTTHHPSTVWSHFPQLLAWQGQGRARRREPEQVQAHHREAASELARHRLAAREVVAVGPRS